MTLLSAIGLCLYLCGAVQERLKIDDNYKDKTGDTDGALDG